ATRCGTRRGRRSNLPDSGFMTCAMPTRHGSWPAAPTCKWSRNALVTPASSPRNGILPPHGRRDRARRAVPDPRPSTGQARMNPRTRRVALYAIGAIAILASANALAHSYAGLYDWAVHHRLGGWQ